MSRGRCPRRSATRAAAALTTLVLLAAAAACSNSFDVDDSDAAVVYGRVATAPGEPVPDASVEVTAFSGICGSNVFSSVEARSDSAGRYVTSVISFRRRLRSCVEVRAVPPAGAGLLPRTIRLPSVSPSGDGLDSLRVDLTLDSTSTG